MNTTDANNLVQHLTNAIQRTDRSREVHTVIAGWDENRPDTEGEVLSETIQRLPHSGKGVRLRTLAKLTGTALDEDSYLLFDTGNGYVETWWTPGLDAAQLEIYVQLRADGMEMGEAKQCAQALEPGEEEG